MLPSSKIMFLLLFRCQRSVKRYAGLNTMLSVSVAMFFIDRSVNLKMKYIIFYAVGQRKVDVVEFYGLSVVYLQVLEIQWNESTCKLMLLISCKM